MSQVSSTPKPKQASIVAFFNKTPAPQSAAAAAHEVSKITPTTKEIDVNILLAGKQQEQVTRPPLSGKVSFVSGSPKEKSKQQPVEIVMLDIEKENTTPAPSKQGSMTFSSTTETTEASLPRLIVSGATCESGSPAPSPAPATTLEPTTETTIPSGEEKSSAAKRKRATKPKAASDESSSVVSTEATALIEEIDQSQTSVLSAPTKLKAKKRQADTATVEEKPSTTPAPTEEEVPTISPAIAAKIESLRDKMHLAIAELVDLEKTCDEYRDTELGPLESLKELLLQPQTAADHAVHVAGIAKVMLCRYVQGSSLSLQKLAESIKIRANADIALVLGERKQEPEPTLLPTSITKTAYPEQRGSEKIFAPGESVEVPIVFDTPKPCPKGAIVEVVVSDSVQGRFAVKRAIVSIGEPVITVTNISGETLRLKSTVPIAIARFHEASRLEDVKKSLVPSSSSSSSSSDDTNIDALAGQVLAQCCKFDEDDINAVGEKTFFGYGENETDVASILRWQVVNVSVFSSDRQAAIKEVKSVRTRYGKLIKAFGKLIEQMQKAPDDEMKLGPLKDKKDKAAKEIEAAKLKRHEQELKRSADREAKQKKELEKDSKKREKESKQGSASSSIPSEKDLKQKASEEKSKSMLMGFFSKAAKPVSDGGAKLESSKKATLSKPTIDPVALARFEEAISKGMSISDINRDNLQRYRRGGCACRTKRTLRSKIKLSVTVLVEPERPSVEPDAQASVDGEIVIPMDIAATAVALADDNAVATPDQAIVVPLVVPSAFNGAGAFAAAAQEAYSELRDVYVDSRMRLLSFHEDHRPAYFGTISRKSSFFSGRRPFAKDIELLNYEYDSEEEWDDEEDGLGEDIGMSDGEEDKEDKEEDIVYDDFFCRDEETSDIDSDGEGLASTKISRKVTRDIIGPRFVTYSGAYRTSRPASNIQVAVCLDGPESESPQVAPLQLDICDGSERDVTKLRNYPAVKFLRYTEFAPDCSTGGVSSCAGDATGDLLGTDECFTGVELEKGLVRIFPENLVPKLAKHVVGKKESWDKLVESFQLEHAYLAKSQIKKKIFEIASRQPHPKGYGTPRWVLTGESKESLQSEVEEVVWTPKKVRVPKPTGPVITPADVTEAVKLASGRMSDVDAASFICRSWDILLRTVYPWSVLEPRLIAAGWEQCLTNNFPVSTNVIVPGWAREKFDAAKSNPIRMNKNREYFLDQEDVRNYILRFGAIETQTPPSPERRARRSVVADATASSLTEGPSVLDDAAYLEAIKEIMDRKLALAQAQALKRKAEAEARGEANEADDENDCEYEGSEDKGSTKSPRLDISPCSSENYNEKENISPDGILATGRKRGLFAENADEQVINEPREVLRELPVALSSCSTDSSGETNSDVVYISDISSEP